MSSFSGAGAAESLADYYPYEINGESRIYVNPYKINLWDKLPSSADPELYPMASADLTNAQQTIWDTGFQTDRVFQFNMCYVAETVATSNSLTYSTGATFALAAYHPDGTSLTAISYQVNPYTTSTTDGNVYTYPLFGIIASSSQKTSAGGQYNWYPFSMTPMIFGYGFKVLKYAGLVPTNGEATYKIYANWVMLRNI